MRSRFNALAAIALAASVGFASQAAAKSMVADKAALPMEPGDTPITSLATVFASGWEAPFVLGTLEPQQGWTATGTNNVWASVSTTTPFSGTNCLRLVDEAAVSAGGLSIAFSPLILQPINSPHQVKLQIKISNDGGADYDVATQSPAQGLIAWRVKFSWSDGPATGPGTIFIVDDLGLGAEFVDTGVLWNHNVYTELKVQFDPSADTINYWYGGVLIYVGQVFGANKGDQLVFLHDNFGLAGENTSIDDVNWIDTASDPVPAQSASWGGIKNLYR